MVKAGADFVKENKLPWTTVLDNAGEKPETPDKTPPESTRETAIPSLPSTERASKASASKSKMGASRSTRTPTKSHGKEDPWRVD